MEIQLSQTFSRCQNYSDPCSPAMCWTVVLPMTKHHLLPPKSPKNLGKFQNRKFRGSRVESCLILLEQFLLSCVTFDARVECVIYKSFEESKLRHDGLDLRFPQKQKCSTVIKGLEFLEF